MTTLEKKYKTAVVIQDGKRKHFPEHRLVWESHFGAIPPGYVVHHMDSCRSNNNIDNLQCMTSEAHCRLPKMPRPPKPPKEKVVYAQIKRLAYRVNEVCEMAGMSRSSVMELIQTGKLASVKLGGRTILIPRAALDELLKT